MWVVTVGLERALLEKAVPLAVITLPCLIEITTLEETVMTPAFLCLVFSKRLRIIICFAPHHNPAYLAGGGGVLIPFHKKKKLRLPGH